MTSPAITAAPRTPSATGAPLLDGTDRHATLLSRAGTEADYVDYLTIKAGPELPKITVGLGDGRQGWGIPLRFDPLVPGSGPNDLIQLSEDGVRVVSDLAKAINAAAVAGELRPSSGADAANTGQLVLSFKSTNREPNIGRDPSFYDTTKSTWTFDPNSSNESVRQIVAGAYQLLV